MRYSLVAAALGLVASVNAHCILQRVSVNGADQGLLVGLRAPNNNNPVGDVTSDNIICQTPGSTSSTIINVKGGDKLGFLFQHVIGGAQGSNDPDNPIASSHKGPIQIYLASVSNAASSSKSGLKWFKVGSEGLNGGRWGVDTMISQSGWWYATLPTCLAPGDYLARVEIIALHSAYSSGGDQFYISCAQLRVTSGGSWTGSNFLSFPGSYSQSDPGILINIYGTSGQPDNGGKPYTAPGGAVQTCPSGGQQTTMATTTRAVTTGAGTTARTTTTAGGSSGGAPLYGQCGGQGWTGPTTCASGTCKVNNAYYSQCL
ncbi:hypothetical protein TWF694_000206 [Orbilia ellipsospora]|uniref:AA9 family lytic polysaccharide monooxygenase n=1 Tax=Orbilia ellipsospora TaxID=2528407 RepID=A0AAV9XMW7_9PEZI